MVFDRSAATNALNALIADAANGAVAVTGLTTGTVTLARVGAVDVRLGKSDDLIEVATAANAAAVALLTVIGNEGADTLKATALGGLKLDYYGDYGPSVLNPGGSAILGTRNTAVVVIPDEPKPNDFVNLGLNQVTGADRRQPPERLGGRQLARARGPRALRQRARQHLFQHRQPQRRRFHRNPRRLEGRHARLPR